MFCLPAPDRDARRTARLGRRGGSPVASATLLPGHCHQAPPGMLPTEIRRACMLPPQHRSARALP